MTDREYEQYLQSTAAYKKEQFDLGFWITVTGFGFILPLVGYIVNHQ